MSEHTMTEKEKAASRINKREQFLKVIDENIKKSKAHLEKYNQMLQKAIESNSIEAHCPWDSSGKNTGVGCHFLLREIFPSQGSNPCLLCLLHWWVGSLLIKPRGKWKCKLKLQ